MLALAVLSEELETCDMKVTNQCTKAAKQANAIASQIRRHFKKLDKKDFLFLYKTYVRLHLWNTVFTLGRQTL